MEGKSGERIVRRIRAGPHLAHTGSIVYLPMLPPPLPLLPFVIWLHKFRKQCGYQGSRIPARVVGTSANVAAPSLPLVSDWLIDAVTIRPSRVPPLGPPRVT
ncbi:hypothetical protein E2C01_028970 [Portunus trituberculatus]|uniref:Uncharacterized protein n=1 Tax=Portunus trituberculatus TaxID=210409 RepID=A0A5B7EQ76_PORTR|nr:hypothetical protein [Portunus trituberculatus]